MIDNPYIVVKPDYQGYSVTGYTQTNFVGSGATVIHETVGNPKTVTIYSSLGTSVEWVDVLHKPDLVLESTFNTYTGTTAPNQFAAKVHTHSQYALENQFTAHTNNSNIHYTQASIQIQENQVVGLVDDLAGKSNTGHTHSYTGNTILDKPSFVGSGATIVQQVGNTYRIYSPTDVDNYVPLTTYQTYTGTTAPNQFAAKVHVHNQYANLSGATFTGEIQGTSMQLSGDLTVDGTIHIVHAEHIYSNSDFIFTRSGNTQSLGVGQISGIGVLNADGSGTTVLLGSDKDGIMRVGWSGDTLVALAGREDSPTDGYYAKWDNATNKFNTVDLDTTIGNKLNTSIFETYTGTTAPNQFADKIHVHAISGVTGLQTALDGKTPTGTTAQLRLDFNHFTGDTQTQYNDTKEVTGFVNGNAIDVSYNHTDRKITLTGDLSYYWRGDKRSLVSPWTSAAHSGTTGAWFLSSSDGVNFNWGFNSSWNFSDIQVAYGYYYPTAASRFFIKETHNLMQWESHKNLHLNLGTVLKSGGQPIAGTYTEGTGSDAAVSPDFAQAVVLDEDLETTIPQWDDAGGYTIMRVSGSTSIFTLNNTQPFLAQAANQYMYINNPTTGALTASQSARWQNTYQILIPCASDSASQKYRMVMLLPQVQYTSLAAAQQEDTRGLRLGSLTTASTEYVIYTRITFNTSNGFSNYGRCAIAVGGITYVVGNKQSQTSVAGGSATNHANLGNLNWVDSGHIGTNNTLASFNGSGVAEDLPKETFSLSGHTHAYISGLTSSAQAQIDAKANILATLATKTDATYTALAEDNGKILEFTASVATTITLPTGLTTGYQIAITNYSASVKTISAGTGATVRSKGGNLKLSTIYDMATAYYRGENIWVVSGDLTAT